jgi:Carboxypeptidase regulatory-like domain
MNRAGKIAIGVLALAAVVGLAWWLLGREEDEIVRNAQPPAAAAAPGDGAELRDANAAGAAPDALAPKTLVNDETTDAAPAPPGNPITFTGRVVDESGRPVQDAEVVHLPSQPMREVAGLDDRSHDWTTPWPLFARARTDAQGRFTLPSRELPVHGTPLMDVNIANGSYQGSMDATVPRLLVQHPAFEPKLFLDFAFKRGESEVGDLVVSPCGLVVGRCVDAEGQPVADVPIRLARITKAGMDMGAWQMLYTLPQTQSGLDGRFSFGGLWNKELSIEFAAQDFVLQRKDVTVVAGQTVDLGDVALDRGGEVTGWVVSAAGAPIAGGRLALKPNIQDEIDTGPDAAAVEDRSKSFMGGSFTELRTTTGADGGFRFAAVGSLKRAWRAVAAADGYEAQLVPSVKPGDPPLRFTLQPAGSLLLHVVEPGSATPVTGVTLEAHRIVDSHWGEDGKWPLPLVARREGEAWRLLGAGANNDVLVSAPGHATTGLLLPAVPPGGSVEHSVELPPEAVIAGRVVDESGAPVPRATVRVQPPADVPVKLTARTARTDAQGAFRLDALAAGDWTLAPAADGFVVAQAVVRSVKTGEHVEDLALKLARGGSIAGRVIAADPRSAVGAQVRAEPAAALPAEVVQGVAATLGGSRKPAGPDDVKKVVFKAVADDRGEYALRGLPAGTYHVGTWFGTPVDVEVRAGEETHFDITQHQPPRLHGRVMLAGAPVEGAQVVVGDLFLKYWNELKNTTSDAGGRYELTLDGDQPGDGREIYASFKDWKTRSVKFEPHNDQDLSIDLAFPGGAMVGEIVDDQGQPVQTQVHWHCNPRDGFTKGDEVDVRADSDATGHFRLEHLPDGVGPLMLGKPGFIGVQQDEAVRDGGTTTVPRIVLRPGCDLEVHVGGSGDAQDPMKRYLIRVRSVADPTWPDTEVHVRFGETTTFRGIPAGAIEITVLKPTGPWEFEPLRTVPAVVQLDQLTHFEQPVDG